MNNNEQTAIIEPYRADIDGLRAIAILAVLIFHINKTILPGGFVGVDIFFVISGYLITGKIIGNLCEANFSLLEFYGKRIKRIAPPLILVIIATLICAQLFMLPEDAKSVGKAAIASLASSTNIYYTIFDDTSYFAQSSAELPLLHLWSLGVEEQFYLLWPIAFATAYSFLSIRRIGCLILVAAIGSFFLADFTFYNNPAFSYYMLPSRAGELLIGGLVAIGIKSDVHIGISRKLSTPISLLGFVLLAASIFFITENMTFPGWLALVPTIGTAMIIFAGHIGKNQINKFLSKKLFTLTGLTSYSAYLWHWPILAFFRYGFGEPGALAGAIIFALTFLLAWLTYIFVEQPTRKFSFTGMRPVFFRYAAASVTGSLMAVIAMYPNSTVMKIWNSAYLAQLASVQQAHRPAYEFEYVCQRKFLTEIDAADSRCVIGSGTRQEPNILLWGDSNAAHYIGLIGTFANQSGFNFRNLEIGSCPPILGEISQFTDRKREKDCLSSQPIVKTALDKSDIVIIAAAWNLYHEKSPNFLGKFFDSTRKLRNEGKSVIIIGKIPELDGFDRNCIAKSLTFPFLKCGATKKPISESVGKINKMLKDFAESEKNMTYFDATQYLCPNGICTTHRENGDQRYFDWSHLSMTGSWDLGNEIVSNEGVPKPFSFINSPLKSPLK